MYLDENILQSRTTLKLVDFIEELWEFIEDNDEDEVGRHYELKRQYSIIKGKATRARAKRSFK
tara:strand:+ start:244 stop:432 length:189 start_codon:yes stop_codon:yes gene_type:complete